MKQPKPTEKEIENSILRYLKIKGIFAWKNQTTGIFDPKTKRFRKSRNPFHINGVSDILGIFNGRPLALEVKTDKGRLSENQKEFLRLFRKNGGISEVVRSVEDVESVLKQNDL